MKILVIVPAYNEEGAIAGVVKDLRLNFPQGDILVVNDGSRDRTSQISRALGVAVIDLPYNLGIGGAMQTGFLYALAQCYDAAIQFDGDGQHRADEIPKVLNASLSKGADLVVGSRFLSEEGFSSSIQRRIGSKILALVVSALVGRKITDTTSGFRAYSKKTLAFFCTTYPEDYPEVEALLLAHRKRLAIDEVPSRMNQRTVGKSSITAFRAAYYMVKVLLALFVDLLKEIE